MSTSTSKSMQKMSAQSVTDSDLEKKTKKCCEKISENIYILANEPTLACFRIQEHVCKSGPSLLEKRNEMRKVQNNLKGNVYDIDYSIKAIKSMPSAKVHFHNTQELLKNALFIKQQLDYEENVRMRVSSSRNAHSSTAKSGSQKKSAFQRFSGSFDIPSLFNTSFGGIASSASADLKDLKTVISQFASNGSVIPSTTPPSSKRGRAESMSATSSGRSFDQTNK